MLINTLPFNNSGQISEELKLKKNFTEVFDFNKPISYKDVPTGCHL